MAHFAKLGTGNKVLKIHVVSNDVATTEQAGIDFLNNLYNTRDVWKQTSYNTKAGEHLLGGTAFRLNYPSLGWVYLQSIDGFVEPQPYKSWTLNKSTGLYDPPIPRPNDENIYTWNETNQTWDIVE
tara:strand:- start:507 stop:884 length:378 start_codon:yes stop_codon:yes gene_type:complete